MTILRVETEKEERAIATADPLVTKLGRTFTLHPWTVNEGQMTVTMSFSQMTLSLT
jgi:hypothetical protein